MPGSRIVRLMLALMLGLCVALTIGIGELYRDFIQDYLVALHGSDPGRAFALARGDLLRYALITAGVPAAVGLLLLYTGGRILASGCFPYPGMPLPNDVVLQKGPAARRRGRIFVLVGAGTLVAGLWSGWESHRSGAQMLRAAYIEVTLSRGQSDAL